MLYVYVSEVGVGVAGLVAIQSAKNLDAIVFAFDLRSDAKEQVESISIMFLEIDLKDNREGGRGHTKYMSPE